MKRSLRKIVDYLVLTTLVSSSIILILILNSNRAYQILVILGMSLLYVVWGVLHHYREKTLHPRVVAEYLFYALLGSAVSVILLV